MDDQRLGIANVGQQGEEFERVDQLFASLKAALDSEGDQRALSCWHIFLRACVVGARLKSGIVDPIDARMLLEMLCNGQGVLRVSLKAEVQRLDALQKQEGVEGRERRAGVAQTLDARLEDECQGAERLSERESMVGGVGLGEVLEAA